MLASLVFAAGVAAAQPQPSPAPVPASTQTRVVLLGTGTPGPDPDRSGPATAIVVGDTAYLVDFGPGVVRRASAAVKLKGIAALEPTKLRVAFVTHLHSDHTVGYPDLIFTPWTMGRRVPLEVHGPKGLKAMTEHLLEAYRVDIETRTNPDGNQRTFPEGHNVNAHEIAPGVVYKDASVTVTAFATKHAMESYGYRFETPDRTIVISGDTNPTQATGLALIQINLAEADYNLGRWDAAEARLRPLDLACWLFPITRAGLLQQRAWIAAHRGRATEALDLCASMKPRWLPLAYRAEYHFTRAAALLAAGRDDDAEAAVKDGERVARRRSSRRNALYLRARLAAADGDWDRAEGLCREAAGHAFVGQGGAGLLLWAEALRKLGRDRAADETLRLVSQRDPESNAARSAAALLAAPDSSAGVTEQ